MNEKLLRIYLQDHLAGSTAGVELARRARGANRGTTYGDAFAAIADEIEEDRHALEDVMRELGFDADRPKNAAMWTVEKLGRLKLNGQLLGYSPLSRVAEIEGLITGVNGKRSLWRTLQQIADGEPKLDRERLGRLVERAEQQLKTLDELRVRAGRAAFQG